MDGNFHARKSQTGQMYEIVGIVGLFRLAGIREGPNFFTVSTPSYVENFLPKLPVVDKKKLAHL